MHPIKSAMAGFCLLVCLMARSEGIKFDEGSWQELTAKAQSEQKFIFVDFYADWCGPCIWMARNVFTTEKAGAYFNERFINVTIDAEREYQELVNRTEVDAFPTLVIFDGSGKEVLRSVGALDVDQLIEFGENALRFQGVEQAYAADPDDPEVLLNYADFLSASDEDQARELVNAYLDKVSLPRLIEDPYFNLLAGYHVDHQSALFNYVWEHRADFYAEHKERFEAYILSKMLSAMISESVSTLDLSALDQSVEVEFQARQLFGGEVRPKAYYRLESYYIFYYNTEVYDRFFETYDEWVREYHWEDMDELMGRTLRLSQTISELQDYNEYYADLHEWSDRCILLDNKDWRGYLAKASVYSFEDNVTEAKRMGEKALKYSDEESRESIEGFLTLLEESDDPFGG